MKKKSLSVKKTTHNSFNFNKILRDKKIFESYNDFVKTFEKFNKSNKIAISVSGGPDSIALCFLVLCYKFKRNKELKPMFFLVDHGLRKNSAKEAKFVKRELKSKKINLKILKWTGKKPTSNLQKIARQNRYKILFKECKKFKIKTILTAHHRDDFFETFFSRLLRGSGTEGLSSFMDVEKKFTFKGDQISVSRPLLNIDKQSLTYISKNTFNFYVEDPSNNMEKFQRVRLRKLISNLKQQGLNFNKLRLTLRNLASTNNAINEIVKYNFSKNVIYNKKKYLIGSDFFSFPEEIVFRSLSILIKEISEKEYPPRGKKMINLINQLKNKEYFKATLGGTILEKIHNSVIVTKEKTKKS